jgi:hypothetical protein
MRCVAAGRCEPRYERRNGCAQTTSRTCFAATASAWPHRTMRTPRCERVYVCVPPAAPPQPMAKHYEKQHAKNVGKSQSVRNDAKHGTPKIKKAPAAPAAAGAPPRPRSCPPTRVRCVSICLDKNRRDIGKSQSKRPSERTQRTPCAPSSSPCASSPRPCPSWPSRPPATGVAQQIVNLGALLQPY